jgi:DNA-binding MarR family transcriptional regulator
MNLQAEQKERLMKVQDCIFFQLTRASQAGIVFSAKKVAHLGVTASQAMTLNFLGEEDAIPTNVLGQKLRITSATMTGILDRLEKMDLIERRPHPDDRRAILVCLTDKGTRYAREIRAIMVEANAEFLGQFSLEESRTFRNLLKQVRERRR